MQFGKSGIVEQMYEFGHGGGGGSPLETVFCCYAHSDNESANPKERWLDRFLEILKPLVRQMRLDTWSDREIKMGEEQPLLSCTTESADRTAISISSASTISVSRSSAAYRGILPACSARRAAARTRRSIV